MWMEEEEEMNLTQSSGRQQPWLQNPVLPLLQVTITHLDNLIKFQIKNIRRCKSEIGQVLSDEDSFCSRSGPISALIATNRTGFVPGELIGFSAEVYIPLYSPLWLLRFYDLWSDRCVSLDYLSLSPVNLLASLFGPCWIPIILETESEIIWELMNSWV